jgi:membrane protease YdiL (CAAX protease family)
MAPWRTRAMGYDLCYGLVAGFAMPATMTVTLYVTAAISLTRSDESAATVAVTALTAAILTPVVEELLARYLLLRSVESLTGSWVAVGVTAVLFGAGHVAVATANDALPGALLYAVPGTLAGVLFAGAFLATRTMWLPIALHAGWNLATNTVFGPDTFGAHRLITVVPHAPAPVSGGAYGTDASVLTSAVLVAACAIVLQVARRRGHMISRKIHLSPKAR